MPDCRMDLVLGQGQMRKAGSMMRSNSGKTIWLEAGSKPVTGKAAIAGIDKETGTIEAGSAQI